MEDTGSPVVVHQHHAAGAPLTPQSKIRALLAQIDQDSDDDRSPVRTSSSPKQALKQTSDRASTDSASSDDADSISVPRGRLARRLLAAGASHNKSDQSSNLTPYERLKNELQQPEHCDEARESPEKPKMKRVLFNTKKGGEPGSPKAIRQEASSDVSAAERDTPAPAPAPAPAPNGVVTAQDDSDSDQPPQDQKNARFLALVARKRVERKLREEAETKARERPDDSSPKATRLADAFLEGDEDGEEDAKADAVLSSQVKPTRKASKKALEAMNRETQRMSRNMQLAHAPTVRKNYTVGNLFEKLGYGQTKTSSAAANPAQRPSSSTADVSEGSSGEEVEHQTPPTSPLAPVEKPDNDKQAQVPNTDVLDRVEPSKLDPTEPAIARQPLTHVRLAQPLMKGETQRRNFRVKIPAPQHKSEIAEISSSDSELEIAPSNSVRRKFEEAVARIPARSTTRDDRTKLKALAHLLSPKKGKRSGQASMHPGQMHANLLVQARKQAAMERMEKLNALRARGVVIQSAEEREREQMITENMFEKARKEVEELTRREREERKKENAAGAVDGGLIGSEDSDDESYMASGDDEGDGGDENDGESGDENSDAEDDDDENETSKLGMLIDAEASEDNESEGAESDSMDLENDANLHYQNTNTVPLQARTRRSKQLRIIDDDDDDDDDNDNDKQEAPEAAVSVPSQDASSAKLSSPAIVNPFANVMGKKAQEAHPMDLSQAFAATMDDSQLFDSEDDEVQTSSAFLVAVPEPNIPVVDQYNFQKGNASNSPADLQIPSSPLSPVARPTSTAYPQDTQSSEMPEPTQDAGISMTSPVMNRFVSVPPSTIATLIIKTPPEKHDPLRRKRKLTRRRNVESELADIGSEDDSIEMADVTPEDQGAVQPDDAFAAMKKSQRRQMNLEAFNRKRSKAKEMVDEQAEESEDEYAGLGGASDDESGGEMDEETRKMLNDEHVELNESQLAAFHADKEFNDNEKAVEKLYKDINSGMLRRKRGNVSGFDDLSDSDEERERRRRTKRAEHARQRKALLADENVGKIAENPKKAAFLKAIEDREDDDDTNFLDANEQITHLVREESLQEIPDSQPSPPDDVGRSGSLPVGEKRKRPLEETDPNLRPPPAARRTKLFATNKPRSGLEIREAVMSLIDDPFADNEVQVAATPPGGDEDADFDGLNIRRHEYSIVDRISLKRAESADMASSRGNNHFAFRARDVTEHAFQVPSLLRRATTQGLWSTDSNTTAERQSGPRARNNDREQLRRGGTKKSSIAYFAREADRRQAVRKVEQRQDMERRRTTEGRRGNLSGLRSAAFE